MVPGTPTHCSVSYRFLGPPSLITPHLLPISNYASASPFWESTGSYRFPNTGESVLATPLWGVLYVHDAGVVSQSSEKLRKMMGVIVVVCVVFGLTVRKAKTEIMCLRAKEVPESTAIFSVEATGQVYNQTNEVVYLGGNVNYNADLSIEVDRRIRNAWCSFRKYVLELYDRPSVPLELKIRMLRAEVLETVLHGCVPWSPRACHYDTLHRVYHRFLTRCIGWRKHSHADHLISYLDTFIKTGSESIEATLRRRRILFAGFVARMVDTRLPKCVMFGGLVGGAGYVGGQEKEWMGCFLDGLRAFGINANQWTTAAQDKEEWRRTASWHLQTKRPEETSSRHLWLVNKGERTSTSPLALGYPLLGPFRHVRAYDCMP